MRVSAEFDDSETALAATKALTDEGNIEADDIEIRTAWPLFEEALPPSLQRPMRIRNFVRLLWVLGAISGYTMVWYCQVDYPIHTGGHPIVPIPLNAIITYECAQITGLVMTTFFFFVETNPFRMRPIPFDEDLAWANGQVAVVVGGPRAEAAKGILERGGARLVRTFTTVLLTFALLAAMLMSSGCYVRMRMQTGQGLDGSPIKDSENVNAGYVAGIVSMPWYKDPDVVKMTEPYGRLLEPDTLARMQATHIAHTGTPPEVRSFPNPVPNTFASEKRGEKLYAENCIFCHGAAGHGDGPVSTVYATPPADLSATTRKDLLPPGMAPPGQGQTDGDLYWTITVSPVSQSMPAFGAKLKPADRFYIVRYLRKLQRDAGNPIPPPRDAKPLAKVPGAVPSAAPSAAPTAEASAAPAEQPGTAPSESPSGGATEQPAAGASEAPTASPTE